MSRVFLVCIFIIFAISITYAEPTTVSIGKTLGEQTYRDPSGVAKRTYTQKPFSIIDKKTDDVDLGQYMRKLQRTMKYNWNPQKNNISKRVVTKFTIAKNGNLLNYEIKESSGDKYADDAAITAIKKSAPFDPLPSDLKQNSIEITFTFDYNVFSAIRTK